MDITLANFQIKAIADLTEAMEQSNRDIILKSCTGSGKTIILTHFMDEYLKSNHKTVFIWLTPGKGNLEEQSKEKMDRYIHGSQTKLLSDIMTVGFEENDACFINWEKLTKKGNNALKDSERTNFIEHIRNALDNGLCFKIIVDESHQNDTIKADDIIELFHSDKIIRCSATPKNYKNAILIDIPEEDVIAEGLIKKLLIINENFEQHISVDDQITYLLDKAIAKQRELHSEYLNRNAEINPLIIVQIPNKSDALLDRVEEYFESKGITYENNLLAVWLSDKKQNLEDIEEPNAKSGSVSTLSKENIAELNDISIHESLNTHKHGKEYHHCVAEIGYKVNLDYNNINTIMRKLFLDGLRCETKILKIGTRELYAFIINNKHLLVDDVRDAMADESLQLSLAIPKTTEKPIGFPLEMIFTYDGTAKSQIEYSKNVYKGYLSSAENRSLPEKLFERYCENSPNIRWFYKNGDKGIEYFSIVYTDNFGKQKSFYPDYIVGASDGSIWVIETKGGFTKTGDSEDIDKYTAKKFGVLKSYTEKYKLLGGIVRQDKQSGELCICTETYSDDIKSDSWKLLSDIL